MSQKDGSIIFSLRKSFAEDANLNGLSLVIGMAIIKSIEVECKLNSLKIKWPNDVYFGAEKLAGILMENSVYKGKQYVLIGVGVNYQLGEKMDIDTPWTDLSKIVKRLPDLQKLTASLINNILLMSEDFQMNGLSNLLSQWDDYDMLKGISIRSRQSNGQFEGKVDGITNQGALKIITKGGIKELYSSMHIEYI